MFSACNPQRGQSPDQLPTQADINALATALPLTQNAPPPPFNGDVTRFAQIDAGLTELSGWRWVVQVEFNGVFTGTPRETSASARIEASYNQLANARRIILSTSGELLGQDDVSYEAVRLGTDAFLLRDGVCLSNAGRDAETAANLTAGELIGGTVSTFPAGERARVNDEDVFRYTLNLESLNLPAIRPSDGVAAQLNASEFWISPERRAVVRYYLNLYIENALIFDRQLPVSGELLLRYDLYDIGTDFNISIPYGC